MFSSCSWSFCLHFPRLLVLYLVEPIDEVAIQNLETYKEKKFVDVNKEDLELGDTDEANERENQQEYVLLCDWMKQQLGDKVTKVQIPSRLSSYPCVLVSGKFGWSANMERLMRAQTLGDTSTLEFMRERRSAYGSCGCEEDEDKAVIKSYYGISRNLLVKFKDDTIDETPILKCLVQRLWWIEDSRIC
ncbi:heat shock protein 90-5, chloroplastic-like protein [Tanacetum coccineum]